MYILSLHINQYIYIYINRDLMWENMRFCHDDSLFPLVHCFKTRHQLKYNDSVFFGSLF